MNIGQYFLSSLCLQLSARKDLPDIQRTAALSFSVCLKHEKDPTGSKHRALGARHLSSSLSYKHNTQ